ncbi:MAG: V-type ATPase subunit [Thermoplasmata archaeon]
MGGSPYASSLGRLKALHLAFLPKEAFGPMLQARDLTDLTKLLEPTLYGPELARAAQTYSGPAAIEVAVNRLFVRRQQIALQASSFAGKPLLAAYLRRWDIENIGLVLAAKSEGRPVTEAEAFLVSSREIPAGLFAGNLGLDDFRSLLGQPSLEAVANQLVRFGYGGTLLPLLEAYRKSRNIFPLLDALQQEYYRQLLASGKFFQGDEWVVREFLRSEIDLKNVLLLLKGKDAGLPLDPVLERWIAGGTIPRERVPDLYNVRGLVEMVGALEGRWPALTEALGPALAQHSLVPFELALTRERTVRELKRLRSFPLSVGILFTFLLWAEIERSDLRKVVYGRLYGVGAEELGATLLIPRL